MRGVIYFAQPVDGGPIKVGYTMDVDFRLKAMHHASPHGFEVIATIPGGRVREFFLHNALRRWQLRGEWYRSCPPVWKVVIEAAETGDISWVPQEPSPPMTGEAAAKMVREAYGSVRRGRAVLGRTGGFVVTQHRKEATASEAAQAIYLHYLKHGRLPEFIAKASVANDPVAARPSRRVAGSSSEEAA